MKHEELECLITLYNCADTAYKLFFILGDSLCETTTREIDVSGDRFGFTVHTWTIITPHRKAGRRGAQLYLIAYEFFLSQEDAVEALILKKVGQNVHE